MTCSCFDRLLLLLLVALWGHVRTALTFFGACTMFREDWNSITTGFELVACVGWRGHCALAPLFLGFGDTTNRSTAFSHVCQIQFIDVDEQGSVGSCELRVQSQALSSVRLPQLVTHQHSIQSRMTIQSQCDPSATQHVKRTVSFSTSEPLSQSVCLSVVRKSTVALQCLALKFSGLGRH